MPTPSYSDDSFLGRHQFLLYRLFSLAGLMPVGAFVMVHLLTNASVLGGAAAFQSRVDLIHSLGPLLPTIETILDDPLSMLLCILSYLNVSEL